MQKTPDRKPLKAMRKTKVYLDNCCQNILESKRMAITQWEKVSVKFVGKSEPLVKLTRDIEKTPHKTL